MAYDGIVISSVISEIKNSCMGGRVLKVQQPSSESITFTIKGYKGQTKLYISASAALPLVYVAQNLPQAPMQAPAFCMLLRKHLSNGRLTDIRQPNFDRIFDFVFEHMDEMGDISERHLIVEIMGRQSNIILTDSELNIIDSMKKVMPDLSNALESGKELNERIIFPGKEYILPDSQGKKDIRIGDISKDEFFDSLTNNGTSRQNVIVKSIFSTFAGFSKGISEEIVYRAGIDSRATFEDITGEQQNSLYNVFSDINTSIKNENYSPCIAYIDGIPKDYHALTLVSYDDVRASETMSQALISFYEKKQQTINVRSGSADIKKVLTSAIERTTKKYDLQREQLRSTEDREKYRIYGELLNTYSYELKGGEDSITCLNYYDNQNITIPLDVSLTGHENAQKYFAKYNKKKRTYVALTELVQKTKEDLDYLLSVRHSLEMASGENDISEIRKELQQTGIIKKKEKSKGARKQEAGKPLHFRSSEGYDIFVGKNNIQNEEITFGLATGKDIWFHSKNIPGSHVIVKLKAEDRGMEDVPDSVFEEAASLAAFYCSSGDTKKVEIDYTERKYLKKPPQSNPGYVIYHTNYSMMAEPSKDNVELVE